MKDKVGDDAKPVAVRPPALLARMLASGACLATVAVLSRLFG